MTHMVLLQDVLHAYYRYVKHALYTDSSGKPLWQLEHDRAAFEDKWFNQHGIELVRSKTDNKVTCALRFKSKGHYIFWLLRWS